MATRIAKNFITLYMAFKFMYLCAPGKTENLKEERQSESHRRRKIHKEKDK